LKFLAGPARTARGTRAILIAMSETMRREFTGAEKRISLRRCVAADLSCPVNRRDFQYCDADALSGSVSRIPAFVSPNEFMSKKSGPIAELINQFKGRELDAHYLGYFECFNRHLYFEAHDVLEELWLAQRSGPNYSFYKGLIQLAGAFVHLQKNRLRPAGALFKLADANLEKYPAFHERLRVEAVRGLISEWLRRLEAGNFERNPLNPGQEPALRLEA
jgi:predicted metal-dependent hydrolase